MNTDSFIGDALKSKYLNKKVDAIVKYYDEQLEYQERYVKKTIIINIGFFSDEGHHCLHIEIKDNDDSVYCINPENIIKLYEN